jgi:D-glycero-D-manno-heptose 1,7-bisphosphate phosphatase
LLLLDDILDALARIDEYTRGLTADSFARTSIAADATLRNLEIIGEAVSRLPQSFRALHTEIEWHRIVGLRKRVIHGYFGVDLDLVWDVVARVLPGFHREIQRLRRETDDFSPPMVRETGLVPAVFIDRDGTLNDMVYDETHGTFDSPRRADQVRLRPGAAEFVRGVRAAGFLAVVVTNQPGLAKGTLTQADLDAVHGRLADLLGARGAAWDALYSCPHHPGVSACECRKPKPGMLLQAARDRGIDLARSWMVGDGLVDIGAGRAAGCRTILVANLKIEQIERFLTLEHGEPHHVVRDLAEALDVIVSRELST